MRPQRLNNAIIIAVALCAIATVMPTTTVLGQYSSDPQYDTAEPTAAGEPDTYADYGTTDERTTIAADSEDIATAAPAITEADFGAETSDGTTDAAEPTVVTVSSETAADETPHPFVPPQPDSPEPDYSVRALNVSAAIFEHVAPLHFYTQRWKIQAHVQLPDFSESLDAIDRYDELVRQVCDGFGRMRARNSTASGRPKANATQTDGGADLQAHCRNAEREVSMLTNRVRTTSEELRKVTATARRSRSRRDVGSETVALPQPTVATGTTEVKAGAPGAPAAGDRSARQLYLAVEEVVSDRLYDRVVMLEREAQWGFRLMKNELRVLRGTNNAVYKTVWKMTDVQKENDANIKRMVKKLRSLRSAVAREADEMQARMTLVELVQLISLELTGMVEQQNEVLSLVTTSSAGRLHPMVMGVAELSRVYTNMSQSLGLSDILVDGEDMPKMVRIQSSQDGRNVEVLIEVPMVKREEFQLYRAYALPRRLDATGAAATVVLEDQYLAVNEADQTFATLSEEQLRACQSLDGHYEDEHVRFVCKLTGPLYTSGRDSCLISLFQQRPLDETPCELQPAPRRDTITKMRMASTWLWLATNATTVRVSCANRPSAGEEVLIAAQSIVQLNGMCDLETHTFRLQAESTVFRNATVLQSKEMSSGSNIAAIDEFAMMQATQQPVFASHDFDQDPIRLTQPRQYHRWLNQNGRAIRALAASFRQVEAARKKEKQDLANNPTGTPDYMQVIFTVGQVALRVVRLILGVVRGFMGEDDDDDFFF